MTEAIASIGFGRADEARPLVLRRQRPLVGDWSAVAPGPELRKISAAVVAGDGALGRLRLEFADVDSRLSLLHPLDLSASGYPSSLRLEARLRLELTASSRTGAPFVGLAVMTKTGPAAYVLVASVVDEVVPPPGLATIGGRLRVREPFSAADELYVRLTFTLEHAAVEIESVRLISQDDAAAERRRAREEAAESAAGAEGRSAAGFQPTLVASAPPPSHPAARDVTADIVICVHDALDDVKACIESVLRNTPEFRALILVDDGSGPETTSYLRTLAAGDHRIRHIHHAIARGYTVSANRGLRLSDADFVVLLNSDTLTPPGWLARMLSCARANPDVVVFGPLSNAASWQSIPERRGSDGRWAVNGLPPGADLEAYAGAIAARAEPLWPRVSLVNGFCYMISRRGLEVVGLLDEKRFPRGYGEEDDFSLRVQDKGLSCMIVDDVYVFHTKSKSFTPEGRLAIVKNAKTVLAGKHGADTIELATREMQHNEALLIARVHASLQAERASRPPVQRRLAGARLSVAWLQPHLKLAGAIRRTIEMTNRLHTWGCDVVIVTPDGVATDWMPIAAPVLSLEAAKARTFDVAIFNDPDVLPAFQQLKAGLRVNYHLAAYMLYREPSADLNAYYGDADWVHFVNSGWTGEMVRRHRPDIRIAGVFPGGIDKAQFFPAREDQRFDVGYFGSIKRRHKGTPTLREAALGLRQMSLASANAPQHELRRWISRCRVFASAAWHEGFNFCPLEAMACGVPVAMTDDGGSREYARHEENCLVSEVKDAAALRTSINRLLTDSELRLSLIEAGLRTAWRFEWDDITAAFADAILTEVAAARSHRRVSA